MKIIHIQGMYRKETSRTQRFHTGQESHDKNIAAFTWELQWNTQLHIT